MKQVYDVTSVVSSIGELKRAYSAAGKIIDSSDLGKNLIIVHQSEIIQKAISLLFVELTNMGYSDAFLS